MKGHLLNWNAVDPVLPPMPESPFLFTLDVFLTTTRFEGNPLGVHGWYGRVVTTPLQRICA